MSDGGLATAVSEMCIGGRTGASIDVFASAAAGVPGSVPIEALLFGETTGCLVAEVDAGSAAGFEKRLAGVPCCRLGTTDSSGRLAVAAGGTRVEIPIADMVAAFSGARRQR